MYVYLLQSIDQPDKRYVGMTEDLHARLKQHNAGQSTHTKKYAPWRIVVAIWVDDPARAADFERYLKSGSGHAFAKRHLW